jgi:hypothetical protein
MTVSAGDIERSFSSLIFGIDQALLMVSTKEESKNMVDSYRLGSYAISSPILSKSSDLPFSINSNICAFLFLSLNAPVTSY